MSENSTPEERTEMPTGKRMGQLRDEGSIFHSTDVEMVASLMAGFMIASMVFNALFADLQLLFVTSFRAIADPRPISVERVYHGVIQVIALVGPDVVTITVFVAIVASLAVLLQTNWNIKKKKIHFDFPKMNPIQGLKGIISIRGFVTTLKALLKLTFILILTYLLLRDFAPQMVQLVHFDHMQTLTFAGMLINNVFWKILYILIGFAIFDFVWGKFQWLKQVKMTKEEVKDERKSMEGDEATKRKIQMKGFQRIWQRIQLSVPKADVVVTNPTRGRLL